MTMGLFLDWGGVPVLLADTLISTTTASEPKDEVAYLATLRARLQDNGSNLVTLVRKLTDVGPNMSYCWAGSVVEARRFHSELTKALNDDPHCDLSAFMKNYPPEDAKSLQVILLEKTRGIYEKHFINTVLYEHHSGREVAIIGSGTSYIHLILDYMLERVSREFDQFAISELVSHLYLSQALDSRDAASARWGGTFEARFDIGHGLQAFERMLLTFVGVLPGAMPNHPVLAQYFSFYSGNLHYSACNGDLVAALPHHLTITSVDAGPRNKYVNVQVCIVGYGYEGRIILTRPPMTARSKFALSSTRPDGLHIIPDTAIMLASWKMLEEFEGDRLVEYLKGGSPSPEGDPRINSDTPPASSR